MKVLLKRGFNTKDRHFPRDANGTEIPSVIDGKKVVAFKDWDGKDDTFPLPDDAEILDPNDPVEPEVVNPKARSFVMGEQDEDTEEKEPQTLSAMSKKLKSDVELLEKKK